MSNLQSTRPRRSRRPDSDLDDLPGGRRRGVSGRTIGVAVVAAAGALIGSVVALTGGHSGAAVQLSAGQTQMTPTAGATPAAAAANTVQQAAPTVAPDAPDAMDCTLIVPANPLSP